MNKFYLFFLLHLLCNCNLSLSGTAVYPGGHDGFIHLRHEHEPERRLDTMLAKGKRAAMYLFFTHYEFVYNFLKLIVVAFYSLYILFYIIFHPSNLIRKFHRKRFQVHFEGNLGDQMETIPVLQRLYEWGVTIDCYLSVWMPDTKRLDPTVKSRVSKYIDQIYNKNGHNPEDQVRHMLVERNYDVAIIAPGPTVNELTYCIPNANGNVSMVWFGISITKVAWKHTYLKHKHCVKLIAVREEISYESALSMFSQDPLTVEQTDTKLMLSGDFSFSYIPDQAEVDKHKEGFEASLAPLLNKGDSSKCQKSFDTILNVCRDWVVIFSRENNFGGNGGVKIKDDNKVYVQTLDHHVQIYDLDKVVFASSSALEDAKHMDAIHNEWKVPNSRMITCSTIEEMFALIGMAPHVITDRYHPGVASLVLGTKLTVTKYRAETVKMTGLWRMQKYKKSEIIGMNEKAFEGLLRLINGQKLDNVPLLELRSQGMGGISTAGPKKIVLDIEADEDDEVAKGEDSEEGSKFKRTDDEVGSKETVGIRKKKLTKSFKIKKTEEEAVDSTESESFRSPTHSQERQSSLSSFTASKSEKDGDEKDGGAFLEGDDTFVSYLVYGCVIVMVYYFLYICYLQIDASSRD